MKLKLTAVFCLTMLSVAMIGCNGEEAKIIVSNTDVAELSAARALELARGNYSFRLQSLVTRYQKTGNRDKEKWARRELNNLGQAHEVKFEGVGLAVVPQSGALDQADEALAVELVVAARTEYTRAASDLLSHYDGIRDEKKIELMHGILDRFDPVRTYLYYLSAEVPAATLVASDSMPAADVAFDEAEKLYSGSKSLLKIGAKGRRARRAALQGFRGLVQDYPKSNKIGQSAYFIAEIYRQVDELIRAAVWYDRAFQWDAAVPHPVRYRAATLYDFGIHDATKALAYYKMAVKLDPTTRNLDHAKRRIKELLVASE